VELKRLSKQVCFSAFTAGVFFVATASFAQARSCIQNLCVGDRVYFSENYVNDKLCVVQSFENKTHIEGFFDSRTKTFANLKCAGGTTFSPEIDYVQYKATGCLAAETTSTNGPAQKVCVGDELITDSTSPKVKVLAVEIKRGAGYEEPTGLIVKSPTGKITQTDYGELAKAGGCARGICAGDQVLVSFVKEERELHQTDCDSDSSLGFLLPQDRSLCHSSPLALANVEIVYLGAKFGIRRVGGDNRPELHVYKPTHFAITKGCLKNLCVGQKVKTPEGREATVVGLNLWEPTEDQMSIAPGTYLIQYSDAGKKYGEGWKPSDLTIVP
jgi:hypothetical protein